MWWLVGAVSHCCSKGLKPWITLPKEKFECGEALLFSSSWIYCLYCKVSVQKNIWYSDFFTKITCFQCNEGKDEICKGMFKLRHVGMSARSRFMVGPANTYVHSIRYNVMEKKFCSLLLPVVSEKTNQLNYWLFHWYRFFKMS